MTLVSAWVGSANTGDELVHAGLRRLLAERGVTDVVVISVDRAGTVARHGGTATRRAGALGALVRGRERGPLLFGGGGVLQDETSALNLAYHLSPVVAARARRVAVAGIGLGAGPLISSGSRGLVARALGGLDLTVRDEPSASLLESTGLRRPDVGADLALHLAEPMIERVDDVLAVALRPWGGGRHLLPVTWRHRSLAPDPIRVTRLAAAVDAVSGRLGLPVRFVAFDTAKDDAVHRAVADRLTAEVVDVVAPDPFAALAAVSGARAVVAMRYHAGIAALLGRRPAVLLGYGPKVDALATDVGPGFVATPWDVADAGAVADAAQRAVAEARPGVLDEALEGLRHRAAANGLLLDRLLGGA